MPDPNYLEGGEAASAEDFQSALDDQSKFLDEQRKAKREERQADFDEKVAAGDPSVLASPTPAADRGGAQGLAAVGANDQTFGPTQIDPADTAPNEESVEANRDLLDVAATQQDVNQGDADQDAVDEKQDKAKESVAKAKDADKSSKK